MRELWERYRGVVLYVVFGVVTTAVNQIVYTVCYQFLAVPNVPATVLAWVLSVAVAYLTNKLWVFRSRSFRPAVLWPELGKFAAARGLTGLLDLAVMFVCVDVLGGPGPAVKLASNALVIVLNYVFSKRLIFKKY